MRLLDSEADTTQQTRLTGNNTDLHRPALPSALNDRFGIIVQTDQQANLDSTLSPELCCLTATRVCLCGITQFQRSLVHLAHCFFFLFFWYHDV
jgi:hypothetical protein